MCFAPPPPSRPNLASRIGSWERTGESGCLTRGADVDQWKLRAFRLLQLWPATPPSASGSESGDSGMRAHVWNYGTLARPAAVVPPPPKADHERGCLNPSRPGTQKGFTELTAVDGARLLRNGNSGRSSTGALR